MNWKKNLLLYWAFFRIAAVVLGGGFAILAAVQEEFVRRRKLLTEDDALEMVSLTQTVPGIIACNSAAFVGFRINGIAGAIFAILGAITPSVIIIMVVAAGVANYAEFFRHPVLRSAFRGITAGIVGLIAAAAEKLFKKSVTDGFSAIIAALVLVGMNLCHRRPPELIAGVVILGIIATWFLDRRAGEKAREKAEKKS